MIECNDAAVLDDPVGSSLGGHHPHPARRVGHATTYLPDIATFATVPLRVTHSDWDELARLLGAGQLADLFSSPATPPTSLRPIFELSGFEMLSTHPVMSGGPRDASPIVMLGEPHIPAMTTLVSATRPEPFWP